MIDSKHCTLIKFDFYEEITKEDLCNIWKIEEINEAFKVVIKLVEEHLSRAKDYTPEQGLQFKFLIGNEIVNALFNDPMLPEEFIPDDWKGNELRRLFMEFDETMTQLARPYVDRIF